MSQAKWVELGEYRVAITDYNGRVMRVNSQGGSVYIGCGEPNEGVLLLDDADDILRLVRIMKAAAKRNDKSHGIKRKKKPNAGKRGDEALAQSRFAT